MSKTMYRVYNDHKGCHVSFPLTDNPSEGYELARAAASMRHDAFYRVFGPDGFVTAWSVLGGKVTEHRDVTIPAAHW